MTSTGLAALQRDIPMYSPERRYKKILGSLEMASRSGITTVVEPQVPIAEIELFERACVKASYHPE
jgi:hypothetical protein